MLFSLSQTSWHQFTKRRLPWRSGWYSSSQHGIDYYQQIDGGRKYPSDAKSSFSTCIPIRRRPFAFSDPTTTTTTTTTTTADVNAAAVDNIDEQQSKVLNLPKALFPWRHERDPLPWYIYTREGRVPLPPYRLFQRVKQEFFTCITAGGMLQVPLQKVLSNEWRDDLANSTAFAFAQSVAAVVHSVYRVPWNSTSKNKDSDDDSSNASANDEVEEHVMVRFDSNDSNANQDLDDDNNNLQSNLPNLEDILDKKLVQLYQAAHEHGHDQVRIVLQMRPVSAELIDIVPIPCLTRQEVDKDPSLKEWYHDLYFIRLKPASDKTNLISELKRRGGGEQIISSTIVAQVMVRCEEVFSVHDIKSGRLLQGDADGMFRPVVHLVQLETVVEFNYTTRELHTGNWVITDWDDLLNGNVWFM